MRKCLVITCWNAHYKAIRAVKSGFHDVIQAHDSLTSDVVYSYADAWMQDHMQIHNNDSIKTSDTVL